MWRKKKLIVVAVLAAVMLTGTIGGVVLAADNGNSSEPEARWEALLTKVCDIYNDNPDRPGDIDSAILKDAFTQAGEQIRTDALQNYLQSLVDEGKIEQGEADAYLEWWQDKPDMPYGFGIRGRGGFRGMCGPGRMRGFGWPCAPTQ